jgi:hypothetical protein
MKFRGTCTMACGYLLVSIEKSSAADSVDPNNKLQVGAKMSWWRKQSAGKARPSMHFVNLIQKDFSRACTASPEIAKTRKMLCRTLS